MHSAYIDLIHTYMHRYPQYIHRYSTCVHTYSTHIRRDHAYIHTPYSYVHTYYTYTWTHYSDSTLYLYCMNWTRTSKPLVSSLRNLLTHGRPLVRREVARLCILLTNSASRAFLRAFCSGQVEMAYVCMCMYNVIIQISVHTMQYKTCKYVYIKCYIIIYTFIHLHTQ